MTQVNCQNCRNQFTVAPEDFAFYEKMQVPPPTFCPDCRMQRRMAYRSERALYSRKCDLCAKPIISQYPEKMIFPVYCLECWWSDKWDVSQYQADYDRSKPFLQQIKALQDRVPRPHNNNAASLINSDFTNCAGQSKNCYLMFGAHKDEDCLYSHYINESKDCVDNLYCLNSESCYECFDIEKCFGLNYSQSCVQCSDSMFLADCRNCSDCLGCVGLRNKQFYILNKEYSKDQYLKKKEELKLNTRSGLQTFNATFLKEVFLAAPRKFYHGQNNQGFSGDYVANSENTFNSYYAKRNRNVRYAFWCNDAKDLYDYFAWGDIENSYECVSVGYEAYKCLFSVACWNKVNDIEYCNLCFTSSDLFGCVGLRNKKFCILNKQYSESEFKNLRQQIIEQMHSLPYKDARGLIYTYGELPPIEHSPFPYMDSVAQEHFPLTPEQIKSSGYGWHEPTSRNPKITLTDVPDDISSVSDSVLKDVIACAHKGKCQDQCAIAFKITPAELSYYRKKDIPLPTLCHNCRHAQRVKMRNPLRLWSRQCECAGSRSGRYKNAAQHFHGSEKCPNQFETSYAPDRPEIVYCEQCYQAEVV